MANSYIFKNIHKLKRNLKFDASKDGGISSAELIRKKGEPFIFIFFFSFDLVYIPFQQLKTHHKVFRLQSFYVIVLKHRHLVQKMKPAAHVEDTQTTCFDSWVFLFLGETWWVFYWLYNLCYCYVTGKQTVFKEWTEVSGSYREAQNIDWSEPLEGDSTVSQVLLIGT